MSKVKLDHKVFKVKLDHKVFKVKLDHKAFKVLLVYKARLATIVLFQDQKVHKVFKVYKEIKGIKDLKEILERLAPRETLVIKGLQDQTYRLSCLTISRQYLQPILMQIIII